MADEELKIRFTGDSSNALAAEKTLEESIADLREELFGYREARTQATQATQASVPATQGSGEAAGKAGQDVSVLADKALGLKSAIAQVSPALGNLMDIASGVGIAGAALGLGVAAWKLGEIGAANERTARGFAMMAGEAGQSADAVVTAMDKAARRTIDDEELMQMANNAWLAGLKLNADQLGGLVEVAKARAGAMGVSTAQAYEQALSGIISGSSRILKRLGVQDIDVAYESFAQSIGKTSEQLTDAQKQMVVFNELMAQNAGIVAKSADANLSNADKIAQMNRAVGDAKDAFAEFMEPLVGGLAEGVTRGIDGWLYAIANFATVANALNLPPWLLKLLGVTGGEVTTTGAAHDRSYLFAEMGLWNNPNSGPIADTELNRYLGGQNATNRGNARLNAEEYEKEQKALTDLMKKLSSTTDTASSAVRSMIGSLMSPTSVTEQDVLASKLGKYTQKWDEPGRRYEDIIQRGKDSPWAAQMLPGMSGDALKLAAMQGKEDFYNFDWSKLSPEDREASISALTASYKQRQASDANKEAIIDDVVRRSGGTVSKGELMKTMGLSSGGDVANDMQGSFTKAMESFQPAKVFADTLAQDVSSNKKLLEEAGVATWTTVVYSISKMPEDPLTVFVNRLVPLVEARIDWKKYKSGTQA